MPTDSVRAFTFGTKAETLLRLQGQVTQARIPDLDFFTLESWQTARDAMLDRLSARFGSVLVAVRSSALAEDGAGQSMAGAFDSLLHVPAGDRQALAHAIDQVAQSLIGHPRDQILIQRMAEDIAVSGVIMTFDMVHGAPYYCIDYDDETGRTDIVTAGNGINKGLFVYRYADETLIRSPRITRFLRLARELEALCQCMALDIEFGLTRAGQLILLQVRRITLARNWHPVTERRVKRQLAHIEHFVRSCSMRRQDVLGARTVLAVMTDWNPAEIIGTTPRPLAASLYRELVTKAVWRRARASMGYRAPGKTELMVTLNGHPYIDVRNSFNSFLPQSLPDAIGEKLVDAWLNRLEAHPEFHDKAEFEIVPTCLDFCFADDFQSRFPDVLSAAEFERYRADLTTLTRDCLRPGAGNTLEVALKAATTLAQLPPAPPSIDAYAHLARADFLLAQCRESGTLPFAVAARHAFIAEALLRSAVRRGALKAARLDAFKRSIRTITGQMVEAYAAVCAGQMTREAYLADYGHLRPGTYEITSLRYDERDDLFVDVMPQPLPPPPAFNLTPAEVTAIEQLLQESGLAVLDAHQLLAYASRAITGREYVKFVFTRSLSDALAAIVGWGEASGLSRDDLSYLDWREIANSLYRPVMDDLDRHYLAAAEAARRTLAAAHTCRLGHIIYGVRDIYVATLNRSAPNFIGTGAASGPVVQLQANTPTSIALKGRIVCIENADPGFDWVFTKNPAALITRFGGANSHMAVRCAEFGLPAAIGCGDQIYRRIVAAGQVELNGAEKILRPLHG